MTAERMLVVYLARAQEGIGSFQAFLTSYLRHPAGIAHSLVFLRKGFANKGDEEWKRWRSLAVGVDALVHQSPDQGYDLGAYRDFLATRPGLPVLFLNSHSEILVDGWLELFYRHSRPGRLLGATGSWESLRSDRFDQLLEVGGSVQAWRRAWSFWRLQMQDYLSGFPLFPNPSIRTNAFLVPPDLHPLLMRWSVPATKQECHRLESGRDGLSQMVLREGGELLVAGADGCVYPPLRWPEAEVFRMGAQRNLIIADNQTRQYAVGDDTQRQRLGWHAWRTFHRMCLPEGGQRP